MNCPGCDMNCARCGTELPNRGGYCPVCGARRADFSRLISGIRDTAERAVATGLSVVDRATNEIQPVVERAAAAVQPAAQEVGKALKPIANTTARAVNDVANAVRPAAYRTATTLRRAADTTVARVAPAFTRVKEKTQEAARHLREAAARRFG